MKNILLALLVTLPFLMGGCTKEKGRSFKSQVLHLNLASDPSSFDPRVARSLKDLTVTKHLFEGLMSMDEDGRPQPALAQEISISDDCLTYTFYLRDSCWSNGKPLTAADFEYAWKKVLDPLFATDYSHMLYPIKNAKAARLGKCSLDEVGVIAIDQNILQVQLESITPYFLELLAFPTYFPISRAFEESNPSWANRTGKISPQEFVCNGPFHLVEWAPTDCIILKKNPLYWDSKAVFLQEIEFTIIASNTTENHLFEKGKIDWLGQPISNEINSEVLGALKKENKLQSYPIAGTFWFKFNTEKAPFDDLKIRKAFSYAINRQEIITHILQGNQKPATTPIPPSMSLSNTPFFHDGDIAYANRLFDEALAEKRLNREDFPTITLSYPITERNTKIVQVVQRQWEEAFCVQVKLNGMEGHHYRHQVKKGEFQVGTGDWIGDFNDPISFLELFKYKLDRTSGVGLNDTGWEDPEYIKLLDLSLKITDIQERNALLQEAERILMEKMPIAPVYHYSFDYIKQRYLQDVKLSPLGLADFKKARLGT